MCFLEPNLHGLHYLIKYFYSTKSGSEHGTLYQLRNAVNRTNVNAKPKKNFNACHDFFVLVTQCHIVAAALTFLNMNSLEDEPSTEIIPDPVTAWMLPDDERKKQLESICEAIVTKFVDTMKNLHQRVQNHSVVDQVMTRFNCMQPRYYL